MRVRLSLTPLEDRANPSDPGEVGPFGGDTTPSSTPTGTTPTLSDIAAAIINGATTTSTGTDTTNGDTNDIYKVPLTP